MRPRRFVSYLALSVSLSMAGIASATAQKEEGMTPEDWTASLGAGVLFKPDYRGSDSYEAMPIPIIDIRWKHRGKERAFLSARDGLGVNAVKTDEFTVGAALNWQFGRDAGDNAALVGLGDIDGSPTGQVFAEYAPGPVAAKLAITQDLGAGHEGYQAKASVIYTAPFDDKRGLFRIGPSVEFGSADYNQSFFGISQSQAARTAYQADDVGAGVNEVSLSALIGYGVARDVRVAAFATLGELVGDAAESTLVDGPGGNGQGTSTQLSGGLSLSYKF